MEFCGVVNENVSCNFANRKQTNKWNAGGIYKNFADLKTIAKFKRFSPTQAELTSKAAMRNITLATPQQRNLNVTILRAPPLHNTA
ncbi:hypothetical protein BST94_00495 [Nonlabens xylanidelens]|nr:hypothetical protein BST94_00495 [Nonlabens xylanidelens]